jgi:molybdenum cofactor cytidylyltransferase
MPSEPVGASAVAGLVAGLLLAAGTSSRMGRNKLLLDAGGEPLLRRSARRALAGGLSPLLVVVGHQADLARQALAGLPCTIVENPLYEQGIGTSLQAGIAALPGETAAVMVLLADMPRVSPEMIRTLAGRYGESRAPLVVSSYGGVDAPPMIYDRSLFPEIAAMTGACGKRVVERHRHEAESVPWPEAALADVDLPEDYARVLAGGGAEIRPRAGSEAGSGAGSDGAPEPAR